MDQGDAIQRIVDERELFDPEILKATVRAYENGTLTLKTSTAGHGNDPAAETTNPAKREDAVYWMRLSVAMSPDSAPLVSFHSHMGTMSGKCWTETKRGEASGAGATNKMPIVITGNARRAHSRFFNRMYRDFIPVISG